jgi:CHAD domain-containing protein
MRELEWQFDAADLEAVRRWLTEHANGHGAFSVATAGAALQNDVYLDTADRRFARAGYALRIRRLEESGDTEATLKEVGGSSDATPGLRSRQELSVRLEAADPALLVAAGGPVGERVRALAGQKPLQALFEVSTNRQLLLLAAPGSSGEIALDETSIQPPQGGAPAQLRRVEIEVPEKSVRAFRSFVEELQAACALQPAELSKYDAGLISAGIAPPAQEDFGPTEIDPEMTIGALALAVLRRQFTTLLAKEPGTRLGDDIEELHDMRVAVRRLRAALALFKDVLPEGLISLESEHAWIGRRLGAVRDLDVQLEQLESWFAALPREDGDPLEKLRSVLAAQRAEARQEMLAALDSERYESLVHQFGNALRAGETNGPIEASFPALALAPDLIDARWASVQKSAKRLGRSSHADDYHRLRIRCKRLRYALEFSTDLYPGRTRPVLKRLVALQDVLGLHQDAQVAIDRLRRLTAERGAELGPETTFAMGEIAERYRRAIVKLQRRTPSTFRRIEGKRWTSFRKYIEQQRAVVT